MLAGKSNFHSQKFRSTKPLQHLMPSSETWSVKLQSSRVRASLWLSSSSQARSSLGPGETETHHSRGFVLTFPFEIRAWSEGCLFKPGTGREEGGQQWLSSQLTGRTPSSLSAWLWRAVLGALIKWLLIKAPKESAILANTNLSSLAYSNCRGVFGVKKVHQLLGIFRVRTLNKEKKWPTILKLISVMPHSIKHQ